MLSNYNHFCPFPLRLWKAIKNTQLKINVQIVMPARWQNDESQPHVVTSNCLSLWEKAEISLWKYSKLLSGSLDAQIQVRSSDNWPELVPRIPEQILVGKCSLTWSLLSWKSYPQHSYVIINIDIPKVDYNTLTLS